MNNNLRSLLAFASLATASILATANSAQALSFVYQPPTGNVYTLDLELEANEFISGIDTLVLNGLSGVTDIDDSFGVYELASAFSPNLPSYSFNVASGYTASGITTLPAVLQVTSSTALNLGSYDATFSNNGTADLVSNANPTAVPFEFSPSVGLVFFSSVMGMNYWRRKHNSLKLLVDK